MYSTYTIDSHYLQPEFAASYLLKRGGEAVIVEANTNESVPRILRMLELTKTPPESVTYLIITHVHLDHAGGAAELLRHLPQATVLAHPRTAKHLADPSRLIEAAKSVYGAARFTELYGEIQPIPAARIKSMDDNQVIIWKGKVLHFLHTRGHANHHICLFDEATQSMFTGDAFGLRYPALCREKEIIFPSTSPSDFDPVAALETVERILALNPQTIYPTHYGAIVRVAEAGEQMRNELEFYAGLLARTRKAIESSTVQTDLEKTITQHMRVRCDFTDEKTWQAAQKILQLDLELNAAGIVAAAKKLNKSQAQ